VDDDDDTRDIIERVLVRRGAEVVAEPSAPAALLRFAEQKFHVLLVDVMMPGMDGYEFIRKIARFPRIRVGPCPRPPSPPAWPRTIGWSRSWPASRAT
jgi:CheY-like chemotaxis protein